MTLNFYSPSAKRMARYLTSGLIALLTNVLLLYLCVDVFAFWYLAGSTIAFIGTIFVSFILQKFWTFREPSKGELPKQLASYSALAVANIGVNVVLMYFLVSIWGMHHLLAQILSSGTIAVYGFVIYKFFIFTSQRRP
jgi:putative flippase GtrA